MNVREHLDRIVPSSTVDLLTAYGAPHVRPDNSESSLFSMADAQAQCGAVMVWTSARLGPGSLLFVAPFALLCRCAPPHLRQRTLSMASAGDWLLVRDWTMELTNQLLSRVKNRLHGLGISVDSKVPTAVSGHALALAVRERPVRPYVLAVGEHHVRVWLQTAPVDERELRTPQHVDEVVKEGELVLF